MGCAWLVLVIVWCMFGWFVVRVFGVVAGGSLVLVLLFGGCCCALYWLLICLGVLRSKFVCLRASVYNLR